MKDEQHLHISQHGSNTMLADVVCLETAKRLARRGWIKCQTQIGYNKRPRCTVFDKVLWGNKHARDYDAPNSIELMKMCELISYNLEESLPVEMTAEKLIDYVSRHKIKLSEYNIS